VQIFIVIVYGFCWLITSARLTGIFLKTLSDPDAAEWVAATFVGLLLGLGWPVIILGVLWTRLVKTLSEED
jgi:hypothetical protein